MPVIVIVVLVAMVAVGGAAIFYNIYQTRKSWPSGWVDRAVFYGTLRWRYSNMRASGLVVRRHHTPTGGQVSSAKVTARSVKTPVTGYYELIDTDDGDAHISIINPSNGIWLLAEDYYTIKFNRPTKLDFHLRPVNEIGADESFIISGNVTVHHRMHVPYHIIHAADGKVYELEGDLAKDTLNSLKIEARGSLSGSSDSMQILTLTSYSILSADGTGIRPFVGRVAKVSVNHVTDSIEATMPGYVESIGEILVLQDSNDKIVIDTTKSMAEKILENIGAKVFVTGMSEFRFHIIPEVVLITRFGVLRK